MKRIFLTLAGISALFLILAIVLGLNVGDPAVRDTAVQKRIGTHMLAGMGALAFATLVHAISFTYFMGTGRWIEETSQAYSLEDSFFQRSQKLKYGILPWITFCVLMMVTTGALGAVADPATPASLDGLLGMSSSQIHFTCAVTTAILNLLTNFSQFLAISANSRVVEEVLSHVRRIRLERGLPV
ncbi:MAG: hypothetical protein KDA89_09595 [Planctomycetaceae bacterium]|nr:hypothetical protein [Planctomycetaceae bacterium]